MHTYSVEQEHRLFELYSVSVSLAGYLACIARGKTIGRRSNHWQPVKPQQQFWTGQRSRSRPKK